MGLGRQPIAEARPRGLLERRRRWLMSVAFVSAGLYLTNAGIQAFAASTGLGFWILPYGLLLLGSVGFLAHYRFRPVDIGLLSMAVAAVWTFVSDSQPFSDFAQFYGLARDFATNHTLESLAAAKSTTTALYFGLWMDLAGSNVAAPRIGGAFALGVVALCTATLGRRLGYPSYAWRFAGLALGLSPALLVYSPVIGSELPLLASLMAGLCAFVIALEARDPRLWSLSAGLLLGAAYLAVPIASLFGIAAFMLAVGRWFSSRTPTNRRMAACLLLGLLVFPTAQTLLNWHEIDVISPSPYPWTALAVLQGTSKDCGNGWCPQDHDLLELAGFLDDDVPKAEADARAMDLARDRWLDDPIGLLSFSLTTKQRVLWGGESQLVYWSLYKSSRYESWDSAGLDFMRHGSRCVLLRNDAPARPRDDSCGEISVTSMDRGSNSAGDCGDRLRPYRSRRTAAVSPGVHAIRFSADWTRHREGV